MQVLHVFLWLSIISQGTQRNLGLKMKHSSDNATLHNIIIRIAENHDLPIIVEIYNQAIPSNNSTARTDPVSVDERKGWFQQHDRHRHPIFVAELDGRVIGWCSLSEYRPGRPALRFTAELSYYVDTQYQRRGIGSELVSHALKVASSLGIRNLVAVLIDRNDASRRLLEKLGFQQWGYLPQVLDFYGQECGEYYYGKRIV
jgi:phosphinothricin acetyltransferase